MKPYIAVSNSPTFFLSVIVAILMAMHSAVAQVAPTHTLVLTETSSTPTSPTSLGLNVTYDGSTTGVNINYISTDHWGVTIGFPVSFTGTPQWTEPEDASAFNVITLLGPSNQFIVNSDYLNNGTSPLMNNATFANFGTDSRDGGTISVRFNDRGDAAAVRDSGSTLALLLVPVVAFLGLNRVRSVRQAWQG
jgi:hypothetical protein